MWSIRREGEGAPYVVVVVVVFHLSSWKLSYRGIVVWYGPCISYGIAMSEELEAGLGSWKQHTKVTE